MNGTALPSANLILMSVGIAKSESQATELHPLPSLVPTFGGLNWSNFRSLPPTPMGLCAYCVIEIDSAIEGSNPASALRVRRPHGPSNSSHSFNESLVSRVPMRAEWS